MILRMVLSIFLLLQISLVSYAVDVAPRISDREIIESLTSLKEGIVSLDNRMGYLEKRIDSLEKNMDQRFQTMESNFDKRFSFLENLILVVIAGIIGLIGFVVWDRKTALRPLERKLDKVEQKLQLQDSEGSRLDRLIRSMRELAKQDDKVAKALKSFSLL